MEFFSGHKPNLIGSAIKEQLEIMGNAEPEPSKNKIVNGIIYVYDNYIKDYKLPLFFLFLMVLFLIYRYKETKNKKKIEKFMKDKYNVPPYNQFVPYKYQVNTMPIRMNPTTDPQYGDTYNANLDLSHSKFNRTYYHGTEKNQKKESDLRHPYDWERNFNNVDDYFINQMVDDNRRNIDNYDSLIDEKNYNLINYAHL